MASWERREPIRRILVPLDFSPALESILRFALSLAEQLDARLDLLHVRSDYDEPTARAALEEVARHAGGRVSGTFVAEGPAAERILEHVAALDPHLVVMGTHGRTGAARELLGSVAESVLRRGTCPVLTLRLGEDERPAG